MCVKNLTTARQGTCDTILPRSHGLTQRIPWWNEELENLKKKVIAIHHKLSRLVKHNLPIEETICERNSIKQEYADAIRAASTENF